MPQADALSITSAPAFDPFALGGPEEPTDFAMMAAVEFESVDLSGSRFSADDMMFSVAFTRGMLRKTKPELIKFFRQVGQDDYIEGVDQLVETTKMLEAWLGVMNSAIARMLAVAANVATQEAG